MRLPRWYTKLTLVQREKRAIKEGYPSKEEYERFLLQGEDFSNVTIHIVDILDKSDSMTGSKIEAAVKAINMGIDKLTNQNTYTLCSFGSIIRFDNLLSNPATVTKVEKSTLGMTKLNDAIFETLERLKSSVDKSHKVLVNIYTDGCENASRRSPVSVRNLISELEGWFTCTFIGREHDVMTAKNNYNIHDTNTMVYDGTSSGLEKSIVTTLAARDSYTERVSRGLDVSKGFYKDIVND